MKVVLNMIKMLRPFYINITMMTSSAKRGTTIARRYFPFLLFYLSCLQQVRYTFFQNPLTEKTVRNMHNPMLLFIHSNTYPNYIRIWHFI